MAGPGATAPYRWTFYRSGGVDQVALQSADDLRHLPELDPKLWIALSMPTRGVEIDPRTLDLLDTDKDGHVRQAEVLAAIAWICELYEDPGQLFAGGDTVALDELRNGPVVAGARRLLADLGKPDVGEVSLTDATSADRLLAERRFNGDGVIPPECCDDDPGGAGVRAVIAEIIATHGSIEDRSGKPGIDQARADAFFAEARALVAWRDRADATALPLGEATIAAGDAVRAVRAKIEDYFTRCRLAAFDPRAAEALSGSDAELAALATRELSTSTPEVASLPIARIAAGATLPLAGGVNPAWEAPLEALARDAVGPLLGARDAITEAEWRGMLGRLAAHEAWHDARPAGSVEPLGLDRLRAVLAGDAEHQIGGLIARDLEVKPALDSISDVDKLCRYQRDLARLLHNYVNFAEFYSRKGRAVFQTGTLYLDGRACHLVLEVADVAKHGAMAAMAGAYLAYCDCVRSGETRTIAAAFTAGDVDNLMVGRNGVYVDRKGKDWEATITKLIVNPISVRQAFWSPYKRVVRMVEEHVAKRAAEADAASTAKLLSAAVRPAAEPKVAAPVATGRFDVGTIAALGVAIGGIGAFATAVIAALFGLGWWIPLGVVGLVLAISGPSMVLAYIKLRRRNLGPLLDANGWAINAMTRINVPFGAALTEVAVLPPAARRAAHDPYAEKRRPWRLYLVVVIVAALAVAWYLGKLDRYLPVDARSTSVLGGAAPARVEPTTAAATPAPAPAAAPAAAAAAPAPAH